MLCARHEIEAWSREHFPQSWEQQIEAEYIDLVVRIEARDAERERRWCAFVAHLRTNHPDAVGVLSWPPCPRCEEER